MYSKLLTHGFSACLARRSGESSLKDLSLKLSAVVSYSTVSQSVKQFQDNDDPGKREYTGDQVAYSSLRLFVDS